MPFGGVEANDAGLLQVIGHMRSIADQLAMHVAQHSAKHEGHGLTECAGGTLIAATILANAGAALSVSGGNLLERHLELIGVAIEPPEG